MSSGRQLPLAFLLLAAVAVLLLERFEVIGLGFPPMGNACADGDLIDDPAGQPSFNRPPISTLNLAQTAVALPPTPAGAAMSWAVTTLNGGFEGLTAAQVTEKFTPAILERVPASALLDAMRSAGYESAPFGLVGFADAPTNTTIRGVFRNRGDRYVEVFISTEPTEPYRLHDIVIRNFEPGSAAPASTAPAAPPTPPVPTAVPAVPAAGSGAGAPTEGSAAQP
jgi:hypothetical protein